MSRIPKESVILGVDPGTSVMGYGIILVEGNKVQMVTAGCIKLNKVDDHSIRLKNIFDRMVQLIDTYHPDQLSIEAPFYGKNVQSMLKLGRAQGIAIAAALSRDVPYMEYAPRRIKQAITGNGASSKEQVAAMLRSILQLDDLPKEHDATDGLAAAICHHYSNQGIGLVKGNSGGWSSFIKKNSDRIL
ncbi:MAG: crossover junction endodeoxyribonuclease RuvC [Flavobacteriales bacterium]|nr:crossover junction endodeoxyribonuclease RuvC [Flavobacteriales bacterium]